MKRFKTASRRGFTLAELLLVIGVIAVLAAVAAPNVAKYAKNIKLRELDDSARSIYMAAQHEFKSKIAMGEKLGGDPLDSVPQRYKGEDGSGNVEKIYFKKYIKAESSGEIVSTGAIESELSENNYIIEFNPETGDVYGVFYSTDEKEFEDYDEKYGDENGKYAAAVNNTADRVSTLGYYGLKNEAVNAPPAADEITKIPSPKVSVINAEKLVLTIYAPPAEGGEDISNYKLKVVLSDADTTSAGSKNILNESSALARNGTAVIILDTLKIKDGNVQIVPEGDLSGITVEKKFSDWETGIAPGANLKIEVTLCDPEGIAIEKTETVKVNSLFANGSDRDTAVIEYGRHLQNLDKAFRKNIVIKKTVDFSNDESNYEGWANKDVYGGRKFVTVALPSDGDKKVESISANSGAQIRYLSTEGGGIFTSLDGVSVNKLEIVNANVSGGVSGAIASEAKGCTFSECRVYVESDDVHNWGDDITKDPYNSYSVAGTEAAGGIVGKSDNSTFEKCFAAVKVSSDNIAGGLIGSVSGGSTVNNCYVTGHTYNGKFEDGLKDNIRGKFAGGLAGKIESGNLNLEETVFTSCSVSGETSNPICPDQDKVSVVSTNAYTLGKAYKTTDGSEAEYTLPAGMSSPAEAGKTYGDRYDNRVGNGYKYPVPSGLILRGDWPSSETASGFFYWEKEGEIYKIYALVGGSVKSSLCIERDGKVVSEYGYGAFSSGNVGEISFSDEKVQKLEDENLKGYVKSALEISGISANDVVLYTGGSGFVTASFGGSEYKFAPDFYAIYAEKSGKRAGTEDGVYGIRCKAHLENVGKYLNDESVKFVQSHDVTPGKIKPIGSIGSPFKGRYDGGGYRIISAQIISEDGGTAGLFGATNGAELESIVLFNPAGEAKDYISLAVKEDVKTVSAPLGGAILNDTLAGAYEEPKGAGITLPYTKVITYSSGMVLLDSEEIEAIIKLLGDSNVDFTIHFKVDNINYLNTRLSTTEMYNGDGKDISFEKKSGTQSTYTIPYLTFKKNATISDGKFRKLFIQTDEIGTVTIEFNYSGEICEHEFKAWTKEDEESHSHICKECNTKEFGNHNNKETWQNDDSQHWHYCDICKSDYAKANHILPDSWSENGEKHERKCTVCSYTETAPHNFGGDGLEEKCLDCGAFNPKVKHYVQSAPSTLGGIVGKADGGSITNCVVAGYIFNAEKYVGGIAGESSAKITECESNIRFGKIGATATAGGIAGKSGEISDCYALVHGIESAQDGLTLGGIAGSVEKNVESSYAIFLGQKQGYPIANNANYNTCYYANDAGFYGVIDSIKSNSAQGISLENLAKKSIEPFIQNPVTYDISVLEQSKILYPYPAIFTNGSTVEHYGPTLKSSGLREGLLGTGPLAGIYYFPNHHSKYVSGGKGYDGWMSYNKNGKIYDSSYDGKFREEGWAQLEEDRNKTSSNKEDERTEFSQNTKGVFFLKGVSPNDSGFRIVVNGQTWTKFTQFECNLMRGQGYGFFGRDSDFSKSDYIYDSENPNAGSIESPNSRFNFWSFEGFGEDIESIEIYYTPDGEPEGELLYADFISDPTKAYIPNSIVEAESRPIPSVGVFYINKISKYDNKDGIYISAQFNDRKPILCDGYSSDTSRIGIMIKTNELEEIKKNLHILVNNQSFAFEEWDISAESAEFTNIEEFEGYTLGIIDASMFNISVFYNLNLEIIYGKTIIYSVDEHKLTIAEGTPEYIEAKENHQHKITPNH